MKCENPFKIPEKQSFERFPQPFRYTYKTDKERITELLERQKLLDPTPNPQLNMNDFRARDKTKEIAHSSFRTKPNT